MPEPTSTVTPVATAVSVIRTKKGHEVVIDDAKGQIVIQDAKGKSRIVLDAKGAITIECAGDLNLRAGGKVKIQGATVDIN